MYASRKKLRRSGRLCVQAKDQTSSRSNSDNFKKEEKTVKDVPLYVERKSFGLQTQTEDMPLAKNSELICMSDGARKAFPKSNSYPKELIEIHKASCIIKKNSMNKLRQIKSFLPVVKRTNLAGTGRNLQIQGGSIEPFQTPFKTNLIKRDGNKKKSRNIFGSKRFLQQINPLGKTLNAINYRRSTIDNSKTIRNIIRPKQYITLSLRKGKLVKGPSSGPKLVNRLRTKVPFC
eukprot:TRINITY_DN10467_c0_g2_i2.p2 TRINITY_DN10467_c0_g2~~TRINITY_DN10467_c0_g2_i2.p2  ORF type:complete len:233 (-),score=35.78 TRINITY_DN10467_c0_g2_i2:181-879(-)